VRMLLPGVASGAVLVDKEHELSVAGAVDDISLSFSADFVEGAAATVVRRGSATQTSIIPLRLVITTPTHPHGSTQVPQWPACT
jgi:hypothetical protein